MTASNIIPKLTPNMWGQEIMKSLKQQTALGNLVNQQSQQAKIPTLAPEFQAVLNLVDAEWQYSVFSHGWLVNFPYKSGGQHSVLIDDTIINTLDKWVDLVTKIREQMETAERTGVSPEWVE